MSNLTDRIEAIKAKRELHSEANAEREELVAKMRKNAYVALRYASSEDQRREVVDNLLKFAEAEKDDTMSEGLIAMAVRMNELLSK